MVEEEGVVATVSDGRDSSGGEGSQGLPEESYLLGQQVREGGRERGREGGSERGSEGGRE